MEELNRCIKKWNLVFTDTLTSRDFCRVGFDLNREEVDYSDSMSLFNFIASFNKLYVLFKEDYDQLEKMNIGKEIYPLSFQKFTSDNDDYRLLILFVDRPTITSHKRTILYLREINGKMEPFVTDDYNSYRENVVLDNTKAQAYLDLFEKYSLLLETYNYLDNRQMFGDGTNSMFTVIDDYQSNLLEGLKKFNLRISSSYFDTGYYVDLSINLGDNFGIDYGNCRMLVDDEDVSVDAETYDKIFSSTYINKKYTKKRKR